MTSCPQGRAGGGADTPASASRRRPTSTNWAPESSPSDLQDLHPPVKVAPDYEKVVAAIQTKQAKILAARADDIRTNALAGAQATNILNKASAERTAREIGALAQAALFTNQIPAFEAAPSVYPERAYLQTFARATANARKYLLLTTNTTTCCSSTCRTPSRRACST